MDKEHALKNKNEQKAMKEKLLADLNAAKSDMEIARTNFDFVYKPEDTDIYIYKLREASSRYEKIIKQLKDF